ncbi:hypothetical protein HanXRQr2_Chr01g0041801 [Helianthus annuus]|uniref:Uncharacterized protein n=1 Tax=Helianthus annuus TaxID=4232 RepID=A0A9K3P526_HELAN|nr:hypothetical protein HanXRQr2_Chr01g0041801 [Helianthus annuus]
MNLRVELLTSELTESNESSGRIGERIEFEIIFFSCTGSFED